MSPSRAPRWIVSKRTIRILVALLLAVLALAGATPAVAVAPPAGAAAAPVGAPYNYDSFLQVSGLTRAVGAMTIASYEGQLTLVSSPVRPSTATGVAAEGGSRVFWSGGDVAKDAAAAFAKANSAKTLEMTFTGRALQRLPQGMVPRKAWDLASARFARGAQGEAHVIFGPGAPWPTSTFARIEGPILEERGIPILQHFLEAL